LAENNASETKTPGAASHSRPNATDDPHFATA
jgi:hypothetical protein